MNKKAQGMSMNIIVVAAIALIILVVLIVIFVGRSGKFAKQVDACPQEWCVPEGEDSCTGEYSRVDHFKPCLDAEGKKREGYECCVKIV